MSALPRTLEDLVGDPLREARAHREAGGIVAACIGDDVPLEVLSAAGVFALGVTGDPAAPREAADRYLGASTDERSRSQLARLLAGELELADRLLIGHDCEGSRRLFAVAGELRRLGLARSLPEPYFVDVLHLPRRGSERHVRRALDRLRVQVGQWSGREVSDEDLRHAVAASNRRRQLVAGLGALRAAGPPRLTGVEALAAIGAGRLLDVNTHAALLDHLLSEADALPGRPGVRVFLTGSDHDHPALYRLVEAAGAVVVGEDQAWGTAAGEGAIAQTSDPLDGIAEHYALRIVASAKRGLAERAAMTLRRARDVGAQLVIGFGRRGDDGPGWDHPAQRRALGQAGIPMVFIGDVGYSAVPSPDCAVAVREAVGSVAG
jgi:benzoyl-CoA reductase/2-hydroxyglutaryl-CoA dehydratase subunit BcrC/BadD/HgdB